MSVKNFKFVSPGVFINEIDNSFIPRNPETIGPCVIGRAERGIAMTPIKVESYSQFVEMFGDTVGGASGGDIYKDGNYQSPMYGTFAAKAFLKSNVAPLTYVRLLGHQNTNKDGTTASKGGWKTLNTGIGLGSTSAGGGAMGLWVMKSSSFSGCTEYGAASSEYSATASLAAVWYLDAGIMELSGTLLNINASDSMPTIQGMGSAILSDSNGRFTVVRTNGVGETTKTVFSLDDNDQRYIRKVFNTNPQLDKSGSFYPESSELDYWLGETYDQEMRDVTDNAPAQTLIGWTAGLALSSSIAITPGSMLGITSREARTSWFIGQDLGAATDFQPTNAQKLFRLIGRGHGEYINKNMKVSIENIRQSNNSTTDYGTFSVVLRLISDSDNNVQIVERYDKCNLNPASPDFLARKIGDKYLSWSETERRVKEYGEYNNQSNYVYVQMNSDIEGGAAGLETLLPFGFYGPPKLKDGHVYITGSMNANNFAGGAGGLYHMSGSRYMKVSGSTGTTMGLAVGIYPFAGQSAECGAGSGVRSDVVIAISGAVSASAPSAATTGGANRAFKILCKMPDIRLRLSASDGGLSDPTRAYFGIDTGRTSGSSTFDASTKMVNRLLSFDMADTDDAAAASIDGIDGYAYIFTLDDLVTGSAGVAFYQSGSRTLGTSHTAEAGDYKDILELGYDSFTSPFWGGFDGWNIRLPDPAYNGGMASGATDRKSMIFNTWKRAIDTVADPEYVDVNMIVAPGLTNTPLTEHIVSTCEDRADAMTIIDLPNVYVPTHEAYYDNKANRIASSPKASATALKNRRINSSYGATFYPWVTTRDEVTGQSVWVPPSVAMMGVLASSERKSQLWFAPAGFNRGGLSDGAAGIPVVNVSERLTSKQRDLLYEANINPIASFPSSGIVVFGQKTLQERTSALDRINVRRLVIYLKKQISVISTKILFEQNVQATWNRFIALVEPFLQNVKSNFGISDYRLILDETTTTPDLVDQNIMYAKIMVKPARAIEFIAIDFVIASTGASFDD